MMRNRCFGRVKGQRGQIMVLGVLGLIAVALLALLTLNMNNAVFERIRLQTLADASAFSAAAQEARVFNFMAYTNRANVASLISAASLHSYMTVATTAVTNLDLTSDDFSDIADVWSMCCVCTPGCNICCDYMWSNQCMASKFNEQHTRSKQDLENADDKFVEAIDALDDHMHAIFEAQEGFKKNVSDQLKDAIFSSNLSRLFNYKDTIQNNSQAAQRNQRTFDDAFQTDKDIIRWVSAEVSNATRWDTFLLDQSMDFFDLMEILAGILYQVFLQPESMHCQHWFGFTMPSVTQGMSKIIENPVSPVAEIQSNERGPLGGAVAAYSEPLSSSTGQGVPSQHDNQDWVGSGKDRGDHEQECRNPNMHANLSCLEDACFTLFNIQKDATKDWGQPRTHVLVTKKLRLDNEGDAWELNKKGTVKIDLNRDGSYDEGLDGSSKGGHLWGEQLELADESSDGVSVSNALVYYHWPQWEQVSGGGQPFSGWREAPNFFNPYWRAKLQPYRSETFKEVLHDAGQNDYDAMLNESDGVPLP